MVVTRDNHSLAWIISCLQVGELVRWAGSFSFALSGFSAYCIILHNIPGVSKVHFSQKMSERPLQQQRNFQCFPYYYRYRPFSINVSKYSLFNLTLLENGSNVS